MKVKPFQHASILLATKLEHDVETRKQLLFNTRSNIWQSETSKYSHILEFWKLNSPACEISPRKITLKLEAMRFYFLLKFRF
jgi:hypothetical protein